MTWEAALNIFLSYAPEDEALQHQLDKHLVLLQRQRGIHTLHRGKMTAGSEKDDELLRQLETADVVLLLISTDFIASDFCWGRQMTRALERHRTGEARVIPILLRPVDDWRSAPFGKLETLPKDGRAVTEWPDLDQAFRNVASGVRLAIDEQQKRPAPAEPADVLRVVMLIGHSLAEPLPVAAEMAKATALALKDSGLAVELRVDQATSAHFEREACEGCDLFIYYGHGTEQGELSFADGPKTLKDLSTGQLAGFWRDLGACFLFSCYGTRFAEALPGPWIAFSQPILTQAPKGFIHALIPVLRDSDLAAGVERARAICEPEMRSSFTAVMRMSAAALPALRVALGVPRLTRLSPALSNRYRLDFGSIRDEDHLYPDHDPFVGRRDDLESLLRLPSPYDDRPLQRVVWVHGDAGMGKSALLRQLATQVRDLVFREAEEEVFLLHLHCYKYTTRSQVVEALCACARELYELDAAPTSMEELFAALERRCGSRGTHVWILDDLTYLSTQPHSTEEAGRLVYGLRDLARDRTLRWQLVVSSRRPGPKVFEEIRVGALSTAEAQTLAVRVWFSSQRDPLSRGDVMFGAVQLFRLIRSTAQYKRSLMLAIERGKTFRDYADDLNEGGNLDAMEQLEVASRMTEFEVRQLGALEAKHGFAYGVFLSLCYSLVARASYFTRAELEAWFGPRLVVQGGVEVGTAYRYGLTCLVRLNFLLLENRDGVAAFTLPPNQRWSMLALKDSAVELPVDVPLRGARERLSLALEQLGRGSVDAVGDLLLMEGDYKDDLADPAAAAAVFYSMKFRSELSGDSVQEISILNDIIQLYDRWSPLFSTQDNDVDEAVAMALGNKGVRLGALGRSEDSIVVYDEVVSRYGERDEPGIAEKVASALFNKGVRLGALGRSEDEVVVYDEVVSRYGERDEPGIAEKVAKALVNKGVRLGALGRSEDEVVVYDEVVSRYGERDEPGIAEQVAKALGNRAGPEYQAGNYDASVASSRAALDRDPSALWIRCNLALASLHLGITEDATALYAEIAREIETTEELDRLALTDLNDAMSKRPDLPGAAEIRVLLLERRAALEHGK